MGGDESASAAAPATVYASRGARFGVYAMLHTQFIINYVSRLSVPYLVPFLARDFGYTSLQCSTLISAFVPGCPSSPPSPVISLQP
jgi:hypothetical protein